MKATQQRYEPALHQSEPPSGQAVAVEVTLALLTYCEVAVSTGCLTARLLLNATGLQWINGDLITHHQPKRYGQWPFPVKALIWKCIPLSPSYLTSYLIVPIKAHCRPSVS